MNSNEANLLTSIDMGDKNIDEITLRVFEALRECREELDLGEFESWFDDWSMEGARDAYNLIRQDRPVAEYVELFEELWEDIERLDCIVIDGECASVLVVQPESD